MSSQEAPVAQEPGAEREEAPAPAAAAAAAASDSGSESDDDSSSEDEAAPSFVDDSIAMAARDVGIKAFNEGRIQDAHNIQYGLLKHFTAKHGESNAKCAMFYLDYGVTLLALIQSQDNEAAALAGNTGEVNEDVELCRNILELANICYDKLEDETEDEEALKEVQLRQAEVHDYLSQIHHERDDESEALKELEFCLVLRQAVLPKAHRVVVSTMFQIGMLYLRNEDFDKAEDTLADAHERATGNSDVPAELAEELSAFLEEAREYKEQGGLDKVKKEIRELFPDDAEEKLNAQEQQQAIHSAPAGSGGGFMSAVPAELAGGRAAPASGALLGSVPMREASSSMSFFPRQSIGGDREKTATLFDPNLPVNTAVPVKKKVRQPAADAAQGSAAKAHRSENSQPAAASQQPPASSQ